MKRLELPNSPEAKEKRDKHLKTPLALGAAALIVSGLGVGFAHVAEQTAIHQIEQNQQWSDENDAVQRQLDMENGTYQLPSTEAYIDPADTTIPSVEQRNSEEATIPAPITR